MSNGDNELALFLAHSLELESEARERYLELSDSLSVHSNQAVAEFFRGMAEEAGLHMAEVRELAGTMPLPQIPAWEFDWPGAEAPESTSYEAVHYRMSLREALELALANERAAEDYYRGVATAAGDPETVRLATDFAAEESSHARALEQQLASLPEGSSLHREEDDEPHMPE